MASIIIYMATFTAATLQVQGVGSEVRVQSARDHSR